MKAMFDSRQLANRMVGLSIAFGLCIGSGAVAQHAVGQDADLLRPLRHHDDDLVVDLGVGLWAWPMPMDYDRDGDVDLLVSCPDKPSNGVYFFENPGGSDMPTFRPAVRVGTASQNDQVSYVEDEPVVLRRNLRFDRGEDGTFDFDGSGSKVFPRNNVHPRPVRGNMWRLFDWEGDGDHDLIVGAGDWTDYGWDHAYDSAGRWNNGPLHGYVYVLLNRGTDAEPNYAEPTKVVAGGEPIDVYGWPSPNLADFDGDGDLDLLCGEFMDGFTYFKNVGTRQSPRYADGVAIRDRSGHRVHMHVQMVTPTAFDWDDDGHVDLIVGDEDGRVAWIRNSGEHTARHPIFERPKFFQQQADELKFGALATPYAADWDGDGDQDILCGNTAGNIAWFENRGPAPMDDVGDDEARGEAVPVIRWSEPKLLSTRSGDGSAKPFRVLAGPSGSIQGPCEAKWGYTTLSAADWDADGDVDIVFNSILSRLGWLRRDADGLVMQNLEIGSLSEPSPWYVHTPPTRSVNTQWRTTPVAIDFDEDGSMDLVVMDAEGYLTLRRSESGYESERHFVDAWGEPIRLNPASAGRSGRVKIAVGDWDGDGRKDVLTNSENATLWSNAGQVEGQTVLVRRGNLARRNVAGHTSSPAICDFDADGKPDLLVGSENGRIYHIRHDDCVAYEPLEAVREFRTFPSDETRVEKSDGRRSGDHPAIRLRENIFESAPFDQCHASTVLATSRGIVSAWFGGPKEGDEQTEIWSAYHDGNVWSRPRRVADGRQHDGLRYPCWNPVLIQEPTDGPVHLFYKVGPHPRSWWGMRSVSYDRGRTFRDSQRLPEGILGPIRCKPVWTSEQTLMCGSSTEHDGWRVHLETVKFRDHVEPRWRAPIPIAGKDFEAIQPTFLRTPDGWSILCRSRGGFVVRSDHDANQDIWSPLRKTELNNPNSGIDAITIDGSRQVLVYNPTKKGRSRLGVAISTGNAERWRHVCDLESEPKGEFSYPAIVADPDGRLHITYTANRKTIRHVTLDAETLFDTGSAESED